MSVTEKMLDGITKVILMNERLKDLAATVVGHQKRLESLTERVVRLETALEIGLAARGNAPATRTFGRIKGKQGASEDGE
jgi:hypothetical protein